MTKFGYNSTLEEMLAATKFAVEANSFERSVLWSKHHKQVKWEEISSGYCVRVGMVGEMPVMVSSVFAVIEGQLVLFYEATSQMVDHRMVEAWLDKDGPRKWDGGYRNARTDAQNFHLCLHAIREFNEAEKLEAAAI